jgi:hypothetical protein
MPRRGLDDIVRRRMIVTDIDQWTEAVRAHKEAFNNMAPAISMVTVTRLIERAMPVGLEANTISCRKPSDLFAIVAPGIRPTEQRYPNITTHFERISID